MPCHVSARCRPQSSRRETWARNDIGYKGGFTVWPRHTNNRYVPNARDPRQTLFNLRNVDELTANFVGGILTSDEHDKPIVVDEREVAAAIGSRAPKPLEKILGRHYR